MKKMIVCPAGQWSERLLNTERLNEVAYFLDEDVEKQKQGYL